METHPTAVEERKSAENRLEEVVAEAITAEAVSSDPSLVAVVEVTVPTAAETPSLEVAVKGTRKTVAEREEVVKEREAQGVVEVEAEPTAAVVVATEPTAVELLLDVVVDAVVEKGEKDYPAKVW